MPPALDFLRHLWQLNHSLERVSKRMQVTLGLTAQQRLLVRIIGQTPGITSSALASHLHLERATVSVSLARLVKQGLVRRHRNKKDQRLVHLALTRRGSRLDQPSAGTVESAVEALLRTTPKRAAATTTRVLEALSLLLEAQVEEPNVATQGGR
jgi:DNA-binding MarR family transcriptional regulator